MTNIILASASPRRKELMKLLGVTFQVITKEIEEKIDAEVSVEQNVKSLAFKKAMAIAPDYPESLVIGCDTLVALDGQILGKPKSDKDAKNILRHLSGKQHEVCTGVAIICLGENISNCFCETTFVTMKDLTSDEINYYTATGEPLDKAGAYGIQGKGAIYIERIVGDYYNVMGLPVNKLYSELIKLNSY